MKKIKQGIKIFFLLLVSHAILCIHSIYQHWTSTKTMTGWGVLCLFLVVIVLWMIVTLLKGLKQKNKRLRVLMQGRRLIGEAFWLAMIQCFLYILLLHRYEADVWYYTDMIWMLFFQYILFLFGAFEIFLVSKRLRIVKRGLLWFFLFLPVIHLPIMIYLRRKAYEEYDHEMIMIDVRKQRAECNVCQTKYPLLLLHGVGFRDLKYVNYWGRIPKELVRNGAIIYYGNQEAFATVKDNAKDIKKRIYEICEEQHCDKVNIIAHSKGGLDARYTISKEHMGNHVASLTTISTPHHGCKFVDVLIRVVPDTWYHALAKVFDQAFLKMGDTNPDFYTATHQFSTVWAKQFNQEVQNDTNVYYQSYMSLMHHACSHLLLTIPYLFIRFVDGNNDGLVSEESAKWGRFRKTFTNTRFKGISHGNIIDLTREDYPGFNVIETYVEIVKDLKDMGY
ncbi:esterase/lipase family protein [[Eubacterium] hominis]|uniref:esterase/lipase family protein n=1 Tax=[Eubacterium] hominis TaxID=2764325 RepID=UPI003A4E430B